MRGRMSFDENPEIYNKMRPTYPSELYDEIFRYIRLDATCSALEIGCGTGQATGPVLATGCEVTAVDPGENLARYIKAKFADKPNFRIICADFERYESDRKFDLIYSATAFHWIAEPAGYQKARRLLKPGGALALFWNHPFAARRDDPLHAEIQAAYRAHRPNGGWPREFSAEDCGAVAGRLKRCGFTDVVTRLFYGARTLCAADYRALLGTYSDHRAMQPAARLGLEQSIVAAIDRHGGWLRIYDTVDLYLARRGPESAGPG